MNGLCAEKIKLTLHPDDIVILMSDGVSDAADGREWITDFLAASEDTTPEDIAESLTAEAERRFGRKDDMSVLAVKIRKR